MLQRSSNYRLWWRGSAILGIILQEKYELPRLPLPGRALKWFETLVNNMWSQAYLVRVWAVVSAAWERSFGVKEWGLQFRWDSSPHFSLWLMWGTVCATTAVLGSAGPTQERLEQSFQEPEVMRSTLVSSSTDTWQVTHWYWAGHWLCSSPQVL